MKVAYGVLINDENLFYKNFADNVLPIRTIGIFNPLSASTGLNYLLGEMDEAGYEIGILIHQDVELPARWLDRTMEKLKQLPENWLVAGVWGVKVVDGEANYYGHIIDSRMARKIGMKQPVAMLAEPIPQQVDALDEVCLIINLRHGFRFSKAMQGFDLYGTYICLWAKNNGLSAWAIDAKFTHNTRRAFSWKPDEVFMGNWEWLGKEFPADYVVSTVYY